MKRSRFHRPAFAPGEALQYEGNPDGLNRLIFDWWCDEEDRRQYIESLKGLPMRIPSRSRMQLDPCPPLDQPAAQGWNDVYLISDPADVRRALTDHQHFSNIPYAALGGGGFLLAQDPPTDGSPDWHARQRQLIHDALQVPAAGLATLAQRAVDQAALTSLTRSEFDLAGFAEQAALRYLGRLYGYAFADHILLEDASRATYRALQYIAIGQHFESEPLTVPGARQALGRLVTRTSQLSQAYWQLRRSPRRHGWQRSASWPHGVLPWSEDDLSSLGMPLLARLAGIDSELDNGDKAAILATLLAGTVGNIQTAVCLLVAHLLAHPAEATLPSDDSFEHKVQRLLMQMPPLPVLPRRTGDKGAALPRGTIPPHADCLIVLEGGSGHACPHVWGEAAGDAIAVHPCLGQSLSLPLISALVQRTLGLKGIRRSLDPLTGEVLKPERLWGFGCTSYPLGFDRERERKQQNLIVAMRVKPPIADNAAKLRRLIAAGAPNIEHLLEGFGHVHFAWFEFTAGDSHLVLRTIFDGSFDAYILHFALRAGDLFDGLFEFLEDAPPRPVAEHPNEFVETIRRFNAAPLHGYLFSAYPGRDARQLQGAGTPRP